MTIWQIDHVGSEWSISKLMNNLLLHELIYKLIWISLSKNIA